jgi:hypothetical protein
LENPATFGKSYSFLKNPTSLRKSYRFFKRFILLRKSYSFVGKASFAIDVVCSVYVCHYKLLFIKNPPAKNLKS